MNAEGIANFKTPMYSRTEKKLIQNWIQNGIQNKTNEQNGEENREKKKEFSSGETMVSIFRTRTHCMRHHLLRVTSQIKCATSHTECDITRDDSLSPLTK